MTEYKTINSNVADGVAMLTLDRVDKFNAINLDMLYELRHAIEESNINGDVHVIVIRGAGNKAFSAGIDLADGLFEDVENLTDTMQKSLLPLVGSIENTDKPVIASINGMAVGLGASIAMQCDLMIMSEGASLRLVFSRLGIVPDGGACWQLVHKLGYSRAMQFALEGKSLDAANCLALGIANKVVAADELNAETEKWATALARNSSVSQGLTKRLMREVLRGADNLEVVKLETEAQGTCAASDYCKQAYAAFLSR